MTRRGASDPSVSPSRRSPRVEVGRDRARIDSAPLGQKAKRRNGLRSNGGGKALLAHHLEQSLRARAQAGGVDRLDLSPRARCNCDNRANHCTAFARVDLTYDLAETLERSLGVVGERKRVERQEAQRTSLVQPIEQAPRALFVGQSRQIQRILTRGAAPEVFVGPSAVPCEL